ncbi:MAG: metal-dependent hydrolase [Bacteroidetes bacterium]|nr:MAG: metal-dependent hydrolase [Bacteroidota bacterium]
MIIRYLGHASLQIRTKDVTILVDPFISPNPQASHIDINTLDADVILITHGHADHVADVKAIADRTGATIVSNFEIVEWFGKQGVEGHPMNHGGQKEFEWGTVKYVNAVHSSTLPDGTGGGNPGGFVLWNDEGCVYIAGDTALTMDMQLIPFSCPAVDLAVLPIGDNFTMGYADAEIASDFVKCDRVLGCHFDTFPYIEIDHDDAKDLFSQNNKELILLEIGKEIEV